MEKETVCKHEKKQHKNFKRIEWKSWVLYLFCALTKPWPSFNNKPQIINVLLDAKNYDVIFWPMRETNNNRVYSKNAKKHDIQQHFSLKKELER